MANTADQSFSKQGKFGRALAAIGSFLESLDDTSLDYTLGRIERLEREVGQLKDQVGQSRDPTAIPAVDGSSGALEH